MPQSESCRNLAPIPCDSIVGRMGSENPKHSGVLASSQTLDLTANAALN